MPSKPNPTPYDPHRARQALRAHLATATQAGMPLVEAASVLFGRDRRTIQRSVSGAMAIPEAWGRQLLAARVVVTPSAVVLRVPRKRRPRPVVVETIEAPASAAATGAP